ncbi:trichothecene efflux pump [Sarocladium implicatum]|nr:trichothecene efflux pump [Sarocladium implicatum]
MASTPSHAKDSQQQQLSQRESELERKRARDRRSQQAMRDRNRWTIQTLSEQVAALDIALRDRTRDLGVLETRVTYLEGENAQLRTHNAALQLSLLGRNDENGDEMAHASPGIVSTVGSISTPLWEMHPKNITPSCLADSILQGFIDAMRAEGVQKAARQNDNDNNLRFPLRPNLRSLLDREHRSEDEISNVVADVLGTYHEIEGLPKQVAVFYLMATLVKWMVLLDKQSWDLIPPWLRPVPSQLSVPHAAWIDRIPWPQAREYLISNPHITLDDFAAPYSSGFKLNWPYDPESVLLATSTGGNGAAEITINPVYEEHMRQIKHWTVGDAFRTRFPELSRLIDSDAGQAPTDMTPNSNGVSPQQSHQSQLSPT